MESIDFLNSSWFANEYSGKLRVASLSCLPKTRTIAAAWVVGPAETIKALTANLRSKKWGLTCRMEGYDYYADTGPKHVMRSRLPRFNTWQLFFRTMDEKFLVGGASENVDQYLMSNKFTTPMLPEWCEWVRSQCFTKGLIKPCEVVIGVPCYWSLLSQKDLDQIVSRGIQAGVLKVGRQRVAVAV